MTRQRGWRRIVEKWDADVQVSKPNERRGNVPQKSRDRYHEVGEYSVLLELLSDAIVNMCTAFTAIVSAKWVTSAATGSTDFVAFSALDLSILGCSLLNAIPFHAYLIRLIKHYIVFHLNEHPAAHEVSKHASPQPHDVEIAQQNELKPFTSKTRWLAWGRVRVIKGTEDA